MPHPYRTLHQTHRATKSTMMRSRAAVSCVFLLVVVVQIASANPNGLGRLPPMGWNTWYECGLVFVASLAGGLTTPSVLVAVLHFHRCTLSSCHQPGNYSHAYHDVCNEWMVKSVAQSIIDNGMQAAGYEYINLDDCWEAAERTADGQVQADATRFPKVRGVCAVTVAVTCHMTGS